MFAWGSAHDTAPRVAWSLRITGLASIVATAASALPSGTGTPIRQTQMALDFKLLRQSPAVLLLLWHAIFGYITLLSSLSDFATATGLSHTEGTDIVAF